MAIPPRLDFGLLCQRSLFRETDMLSFFEILIKAKVKKTDKIKGKKKYFIRINKKEVFIIPAFFI